MTEDLEVAPRDRGRHKTTVRTKLFDETGETDSSGTEARLTAGGLLGGGLPAVVCSSAGHWFLPAPENRDFRVTPAPAAVVSASVDRLPSPTSCVLGQGPPLTVIPLLDPVSSGVLV